MTQVKLSKRAVELFNTAEAISKENRHKAIHPIHLFIAAFKMNYDANIELKSNVTINEENLLAAFNDYNEEDAVPIDINSKQQLMIFRITEKVLFDTKTRTELYEEHGQIFISDGQILKTVIENKYEDFKELVNEADGEKIISIMSQARDMIVDLKRDFNVLSIPEVIVRKVNKSDELQVKEFVLKSFYERWASTIDIGFETEDIPVYIAIVNDQIVGFAGFNISKRRKGYFGPLGVLKNHRDKKIGEALVLSCMIEMKNMGFDNCIIGNASTFDFYEKTCGAKLIEII